MADYEPPFANENTAKRFQNATEIAQGYGCGDADIDLFNGLMFQIQSELGEVITWGGVTHTNARHTLVREAIQNMITPYLLSVNGDSDGGTIAANGNRQFILQMSDSGPQWTLQLPDEEAQQPAFSFLSSPVDIINVTQNRTSGSYDTGNVNLNLNTLSGVTVPAGATGVMLQTGVSVSGVQEYPGSSSSITSSFAWILAGGTLTGSDMYQTNSRNNLVCYVDTNLGANDNDNVSYPIIPISGTTLPYRARIKYPTSSGTEHAVAVIRLIGFTF